MYRAAMRSMLLVLLVTGTSLAQAPASTAFVPLTADSTRAGALRTPVTVSFTDATIADAVSTIARQAGLSLTFDATLAGLDRRVSVSFTHAAASEAILRVLEGTTIQVMVSPSGQVVLVSRATRRAGVVRGSLRDAATDTPVAGGRVELVGTRFAAVSRENGAFSLGVVPFGAYTARITRMGFRPVTIDALRVATDIPSPIDVMMEHAPIPLAAVVVTPGYFGMMQPTLDAPQTMTRERIETVPQIAEDIYRAVNRLPGVTSNDFSADFVVRGGLGTELYATLDGLELIEPFHIKDIGGGLSIIDSRAIGGVELITGGFSTEYGDRLTGVFTMRSLDPTIAGSRTSVGLSVMNARLMSQGSFGGGRGGWLFSARRGYLDLALKLASTGDSIKPRYYDVFAKTQYDFGRVGRIALHALDAGDAMTYLDTPDPSIRSHYHSSYVWATWEGSVGSRLLQQTVASVGRLSWHRDGDRVERGNLTALIDDRRWLNIAGFRQDWSLALTRRSLVKFGVDARQGSAGYDYMSRVLDDSVRPENAATGPWDTTAVNSLPAGTRVGLYVAPRVRLFNSLTTELGLRYDRTNYTGDALFSPRLNIAWQPRVGTSIRGAWGRYSQSQGLSSLQAQDGIDQFTPAERAEHRVLGVEQALPNGFVARVEGYERRILEERPRYISVGPGIDVFPEITWDRVRIDPTSGRARGVEILVSRDVGAHTDWSLGYALASVTDRIDGRDVPRGTDQRHTVTADWAFRPTSNRWRFSVATLWHSGWPYTPGVLTVDTLENTPTRFRLSTRWTPGELYTERLTPYRRVDVRFTRYFETSTGRISLFAEVYNLFNTSNRRGYNPNLSVDRQRNLTVSQGNEYWIARLPTFGITYEFGGPGR
jgi:TonB-dependent receptor-like protein/carboxypeptidase family protein